MKVTVTDRLILTPSGEKECLPLDQIQSVQLVRIQTQDHTRAGIMLLIAGFLLLWAIVGIIFIAWGAGCFYTKGYMYRVEACRGGETVVLLQTPNKGVARRLLNDILTNRFVSNTII